MTQHKDEIKRPEGKVTITVRDKKGKVVEVRDKHNIFLDQGRDWLASLVSGQTVFSLTHSQIIGYMGFGKGGALQDVPAERGPQTENAGVTALDTRVDISSGPTTNLGSTGTPVILTPPTTVRFTKIITTAEISLSTTGVPLSECGLFIASKSDLAGFPSHPDIDITAPPGGTPIMVAYQQFRTLTKTQDLSIQFDWELRF